jgi:hypothetical protein
VRKNDPGSAEHQLGRSRAQDRARKRGSGAKRRDSSFLFPGLVYLLIVLYGAFFSWLSILRHETFQSNAMDLGYTDQAVWNTLC